MGHPEKTPPSFNEVEAIPKGGDGDQDFDPKEDEKRIPILNIKQKGDRYEVTFSVNRALAMRFIVATTSAALGAIGYAKYHG